MECIDHNCSSLHNMARKNNIPETPEEDPPPNIQVNPLPQGNGDRAGYALRRAIMEQNFLE